MRKKCNLGWFREFLFTISSLEWILHSLYQGCVFSKIWRELGFVHYIEYFTISRFTISRLGCMYLRMNFLFSFSWSICIWKSILLWRYLGNVINYLGQIHSKYKITVPWRILNPTDEIPLPKIPQVLFTFLFQNKQSLLLVKNLKLCRTPAEADIGISTTYTEYFC